MLLTSMQKKLMASTSLHIAFSLLYFVSFCKSDDRIVPGTPLSVNDMLISDGGAFALGFFSPTNTNTSLYVGIWYNNIPLRTVVWVANRNNPITDPSSATLAVTRRSGLVLSNAKGRILWTTENNITGGAGATAQLLNSGNLVLRSTDGTVVWQSFDHPTDTLLPGMRLRLSYNSHISERLVSWKGPDDPATGDFSLGGDPSTYLQLLAWRGSAPYWRSAVWNGATAFGVYQTNTKSVLYQTVVDTGDEIYMTFSVSDGAPSTQFSLDYSGTVLFQSWNSNSSAWMVLENSTTSDCDHYGSCGPFGYCDHTEAVPTCKCLEGFEPNGVNFSKGCRRNKALNCGDRDYFLTLPGMKVPDKFLHVRNKSFDQCAAGCSSNCSCTGYAYANLSSVGTKGDLSRCLLWMGELIDTEKASYRSGGENLYLRLARLPGNKRSDNAVKIVLPVAACLLVLTCMCIVWIYKCRGKRGNKETKKRQILGDLRASEELREGDLEFLFISFEDIVAGTDNFSDSNMLGHGGFGKVYKAMLEDANEVAVKRLSKGSGQGIEEFRNEVVLIAKLQHKNLVKLVGCCIHGEEKLLIYEYLPNKSLDAFLFNAARKPVLDWPTRLKIIKGIARGLLYLHQDSRLTIIHRDLKASNILLDLEMSPKISDFGMARIFGCNQQQANTNRVVGTYGYMSPEYAMNGTFSIQSDTYSFGVLLLEIISGLKISSTHLIMDFSNLIAYAWSLWKDGKANDLVDSSIVESCSPNEVLRCIHIGLLCVQDNPNARPLMSSVVFMLENETTTLPSPRQPIYFVQRNYETEGAGENNEMCDLHISINNVSVTMLEGR